MKKTILMLLLLLGSAFDLFADEFAVKSFEADPSDLSARRYGRVDQNDDPCAIIKVTTDLKELKFDSNLGIEDVAQKEGEYWLYVSPTEKMLEIWTEGFIKLSYIISVPVKSSSVYVMVLTSKGGEIEIADKDLFQVVFKLNEAEVFIFKGRRRAFENKGQSRSFQPPQGTTPIQVRQRGICRPDPRRLGRKERNHNCRDEAWGIEGTNAASRDCDDRL